MMNIIFEYIADTNLFLILLTPAVYLLAKTINRKFVRHQLLHPLILSVILLIPTLLILDISYADYVHENRLLEWLIGPAVVALAVPLYENLHLIKRWLPPVILAITVMIMINPALTWLIASFINLESETQIALTTRSVTTPIALSINELLQGNSSLAAGLVMTTGVFGTLLTPPLLKILKVKSPEIQGITLGLTSHAIGTQRAFEISSACGAFAALTMILTGILASVILPFLGLLFAN